MIVLKDINKTFTIKDKQVTAVQDVNLTIADKEIYGIIGFSGAGKSTLVRCINLLERPNGLVGYDNTLTRCGSRVRISVWSFFCLFIIYYLININLLLLFFFLLIFDKGN